MAECRHERRTALRHRLTTGRRQLRADERLEGQQERGAQLAKVPPQRAWSWRRPPAPSSRGGSSSLTGSNLARKAWSGRVSGLRPTTSSADGLQGHIAFDSLPLHSLCAVTVRGTTSR